MKVLNFGSLNYDYTYQVSHMVKPGETLASAGLSIHCGGKGLNQSIALRRAGVPVSHAGMVGEDGALLLDTCRREGIDTSLIRSCGGKSGHAIIQVTPKGENCILLYGGANRKNTQAYIESVLSGYGAGDFLLLQNEINMLPEVMRAAAKRGMVIAFNPSPCDLAVRECDLSQVSCLLINETEGEQLCGEKEPDKVAEKLLARYPESSIVLTLGAKGVLYRSASESLRVPSFPVKAVDTTGAGDTFTGYYLAGILQGLPQKDALTKACMAAALAVTREGASESIPTAGEVDRFCGEMSGA